MFVSSLRPPRTGRLAPILDLAEWWWRCVLWGALAKGISVLLGVMSVAILFAEATLLWRNPHTVVDLSLFSQLVTAVGMQAELVQVRPRCTLTRISPPPPPLSFPPRPP